ncbi:hypothetical protein B0T16DRAFT_78727 [Cercophora newfieldiana]|uniref:Uncharacterized protein n=1 Tax=Cercophora newfieldiana TaxID=92897 RepID=A0AA39YEY5_9PEZI|nr:hypothetical protein B0T16DRAFT_78727 [Cercophora newfieldiana]
MIRDDNKSKGKKKRGRSLCLSQTKRSKRREVRRTRQLPATGGRSKPPHRHSPVAQTISRVFVWMHPIAHSFICNLFGPTSALTSHSTAGEIASFWSPILGNVVRLPAGSMGRSETRRRDSLVDRNSGIVCSTESLRCMFRAQPRRHAAERPECSDVASHVAEADFFFLPLPFSASSHPLTVSPVFLTTVPGGASSRRRQILRW